MTASNVSRERRSERPLQHRGGYARHQLTGDRPAGLLQVGLLGVESTRRETLERCETGKEWA
jgi:hypothetical protein